MINVWRMRHSGVLCEGPTIYIQDPGHGLTTTAWLTLSQAMHDKYNSATAPFAKKIKGLSRYGTWHSDAAMALGTLTYGELVLTWICLGQIEYFRLSRR